MKTSINANEYKVLKAIADQNFEDYSADVETIASETGLSVNQVKGYVGALVQKDLACTDCDNRDGTIFNDIWVNFTEAGAVSFGWDNYGDDEWNQMLEDMITVISA